MINFPCHCKHRFSVAEDMAGGMVQCPKCGRLNDVPLLSDLPHIAEDGTYNLELRPDVADDALPELQRIYAKGRLDEHGNEIDLRQNVESLFAESEELPLEPVDEPKPASPKYDPITGELIEEVHVDESRVSPGMPAVNVVRPALGFPNRASLSVMGPLQIFVRLFHPLNLFVMFLILAGHIAFLLLISNRLTLFIMLPFVFLIPLAIVAHYGNIVDETGPNRRDELPTPMRSLGWHEDLWGPFRDWVLSLLVCYGPAFGVLMFPPPQQPVAVVMFFSLLAIGTVAAPAMLLTMLTSGTIFNIRPDRIIGVMGRCGFHYVVMVLLWIVICAAYVPGMLIGLDFTGWIRLRPPVPSNHWLLIPLLTISIFLMHYLTWYMGLAYRAHHEDFPWTLQRHYGKPREGGQGFAVIPRRRVHRAKGEMKGPRTLK
jgi:hypothetical protein